ncbi:hypothetical protein [Flavobacterium saccharophilum]|uniref:Erythromycin esterase n=1 Tax=Flavobacterium saccharophilum TaxID=29534 RepID=A0A1M7M5C1_9FLAO|nr:hypothetical protein [Flavobacterium saccharophilum]SHM85842.1 hypothetical protein SAMN05444366_4357 [Flavobacterium saccharophilum]
MHKSIILFLLILSIKLYSQEKKETYLFSEDITANFENDKTLARYQIAATNFSISGYYKLGLETWDKQAGADFSKKKTISTEDSLYFKSFKPVNAKKYIIDRSKNEQIILINEAHNNSRHRVFTTSLLHDLYNNGYRFLGLEALWENLDGKEFATLQDGFYIKEPQFGNLIKEAKEIGFTVFQYESTSKVRDGGKTREIEQAENIVKMMKENPNSKFLIHCGYEHIIEGTPGIKTWEKAMAGRIIEMTGINPFTIDQTYYSEKGNTNLNSPYIEMVNLDYPVIMINNENKAFSGDRENTKNIDCAIIHPITKYKNNRPDWLNLSKERKTIKIENSKIKEYPALVLAYRINEFEKNGIPADIIELASDSEKSNLILKKGEYKIIVKNKDYQIVNEFTQTVK